MHVVPRYHVNLGNMISDVLAAWSLGHSIYSETSVI